MAITIISPLHSFIRFGETAAAPLCIWGGINFCLPVYEQDDIYFQIVVEGTENEIDSLCNPYGDEITVSLVNTCGGSDILTFTEKPERFRLSATQVLYNWTHGLPNFTSAVAVGECFHIQLVIEATPYGYPDETVVKCSNCIERISDPCFTSVIEYGNDEDGFGFKYCMGGNIDNDEDPVTMDCSPTIVTFNAVSTVSIPYTALLQSKYGVFPTVQVWIYDSGGQLINAGITAAFDGYPATVINIDLGGPANGIVVIR